MSYNACTVSCRYIDYYCSLRCDVIPTSAQCLNCELRTGERPSPPSPFPLFPIPLSFPCLPLPSPVLISPPFSHPFFPLSSTTSALVFSNLLPFPASPSPNPARGSGERCKLSQRGPGQIPGHKRILVGLRPELVNRDWGQQFWSFTFKQ